jgi:hypothetical protein
MGSTSLLDFTGQMRGDRLDQPGVRVRCDETDSAEAAGDEDGEGCRPRSAGLQGRDAQAEDFAAAVGVDHNAALTDLRGDRVGGHERNGLASFRRRWRNWSTCSSSSADDRDQRRLGTFAALRQLFREVGGLPQLRNRDVDRADPSVEVAVPGSRFAA